jgi:uncharacterized protein
LLLATKADVNSKDSDGPTPLIFAAMNGYTEIVEILLENDADMDAEDKDGRTALQWAVFEGRGDIKRLLVTNGAQEPEDFYGFHAMF